MTGDVCGCCPVGRETLSAGRGSRVRCQYQWRIVGDDRTVFQVPFVRVYVIGAPLEPTAGERAQIPGQSPLTGHKVQSHFELLFELFLSNSHRYAIYGIMVIYNFSYDPYKPTTVLRQMRWIFRYYGFFFLK